MPYIYILECANGTYYTGWTTDLEKRVKKHNAKKASKYTRTCTPVKLVYFEEKEDKSSCLRREYEIKKLSRSAKEELINQKI